MTASRGITLTTTAKPHPSECCMCGDCGFSQELFQCQLCHFRSQHRYCSNLYPKAESYNICNWCLSENEDSKEKSPNSSNSSSSNRSNGSADDDKNKKKKMNRNSSRNINGVKKGLREGALHAQLNKPIKKQRSPEEKPPPPVVVSTRKRIVTNGDLEERLRRSKSENISNRSGITRQVFRNKVRRYKLLDEVSS